MTANDREISVYSDQLKLQQTIIVNTTEPIEKLQQENVGIVY